MAKKKQNRPAKSFSEAIGIKNIFQNDIFNGIFGVVLIIFAIYMTIAFVSYFTTGAADQSIVLDLKTGEWMNTQREFQNTCGSTGALLSHFFISRCFGFAALLIPVLLLVFGLRISRAYAKINLFKWFLSLIIIMLWSSVTLAKFLTPFMNDQVYNPGGDHGAFVCQWLENVIGAPGLMAVLGIVAIIFLTYISNETINIIRKILNPVSIITDRVKFRITNVSENNEDSESKETENTDFKDIEPSQTIDLTGEIEQETVPTDETEENGETEGTEKEKDTDEINNVEGMTVTVAAEEEKASGKSVQGNDDISSPINPKEPFLKYKYPTLDLLKKYDADDRPYIDMKEQTANKNRIIEVLNSFGVKVSSITATVGPTITLYTN